jgi:hypothetical protein
VVLLQPEEARDERAGSPALPAASDRKMKKKKEVIDLTLSEKRKRKRESKATSNKLQSEKRKIMNEQEKERLKSLSPGEKEKIARGVIKNDKEWLEMELYGNKENEITWSTGKKKIDWGEESGEAEGDWWELNKLPQILEIMEKGKKEQRERAELARIERNRSRWALKVQDLEEKEKENEKEKEKEKEKPKKEKETKAERKFRLASERSLGRQQWREQINRMMTCRPEPRVRFDATDSPLSSNMEEGELDYLTPLSDADEESEVDNNNNN